MKPETIAARKNRLLVVMKIAEIFARRRRKSSFLPHESSPKVISLNFITETKKAHKPYHTYSKAYYRIKRSVIKKLIGFHYFPITAGTFPFGMEIDKK